MAVRGSQHNLALQRIGIVAAFQLGIGLADGASEALGEIQEGNHDVDGEDHAGDGGVGDGEAEEEPAATDEEPEPADAPDAELLENTEGNVKIKDVTMYKISS